MLTVLRSWEMLASMPRQTDALDSAWTFCRLSCFKNMLSLITSEIWFFHCLRLNRLATRVSASKTIAQMTGMIEFVALAAIRFPIRKEMQIRKQAHAVRQRREGKTPSRTTGRSASSSRLVTGSDRWSYRGLQYSSAITQ